MSTCASSLNWWYMLGNFCGGERVAVPLVLPRSARDLPRLADAAGRQDDGAGAKQDEAAGFADVAERSGHSSAHHEQAHNGAFHVDVESGVHGAVLEHADHLQPGAVTDVGQTTVGMAAEGALIDAAIGRAIEQRAPRLELRDAVGRFLGAVP